MKLLLENWREYLETLEEEEEIDEGWVADKITGPLVKRAKKAFAPVMSKLKSTLSEIEEQEVFYVNINDVLPTEELGHGKDHDCPSNLCDEIVNKKMLDIENGRFEPIEVCNQKPVKTYRTQGEKVGRAPKSGVPEPFYHVINGHHRLEAAKKLGMQRIPVYITSEEN